MLKEMVAVSPVVGLKSFGLTATSERMGSGGAEGAVGISVEPGESGKPRTTIQITR